MTNEQLKALFSRNLRVLMAIQDPPLNQQGLADLLTKKFPQESSVSQASVSSWIQEKKLPRPITVQHIGEIFGKDAGWMLSDHDNEEQYAMYYKLLYVDDETIGDWENENSQDKHDTAQNGSPTSQHKKAKKFTKPTPEQGRLMQKILKLNPKQLALLDNYIDLLEK